MRPRLAVVGPGRVGWALARGAAGVGYRVTGVAGGAQEARQRLAASVAARVLSEPAAVEADLVLLTVPDIFLPALAQTVRAASAAFVVHAAGALPAAALGRRAADAAAAPSPPAVCPRRRPFWAKRALISFRLVSPKFL